MKITNEIFCMLQTLRYQKGNDSFKLQAKKEVVTMIEIKYYNTNK